MKKYDKLIIKAKQAYDKGDLDLASKYYEEAFKEKIIIADYLMLAYIYVDLNKYNLAEKIFKNVKMIDDGIEVHFGLANIYERTGRKKDAIELYSKVVEENDDFDIAHFSLAYLYDEIGEEQEEDINGDNISKAVIHYEKSLQLNNNNFWAHINLGSIYERNNIDDKALYHFSKAYEIDKNEKMVCYNLGVVYSKIKQYDKALRYYLEELKKENPYPSSYYNIGILYKDGFKDYDKAQYYYLLGLEKNQEDYNIWYNLGCVHALKKDFENAFNCFKYIYYKKKKYLGYLDQDEELEEFRKTNYYMMLKNGL